MSLEQKALQYHHQGKYGIHITKPMKDANDLSLAYTPGVAVPCLHIKDNKNNAYKYTNKANTVAVLSNGTAVLGLGNIGALASKPVMEGKAILFKRFGFVDGMDVVIDTENPEEFVNIVKKIALTWGGINLEDIKAPECFFIERALQESLDIPVFHDDQHGTAIITLAALINACNLTQRKFEDLKIVVSGAGAASIACIELIKKLGVADENIILCDSRGVIYQGRTEGMNEWKEKHAVSTSARTIAEAMKGSDVFLGLSVKGIVTQEMIKTMNDKPIIFAMANPDPEITPEEIMTVRSDAIIATGRSDYNNQVNNVMGFPYIFRGALDVRSSRINDEMKIAAAHAISELAREDVPDEVKKIYNNYNMSYSNEYIIPTIFDPRLISTIPIAVAKAAINSGVARETISDWNQYESKLRSLNNHN